MPKENSFVRNIFIAFFIFASVALIITLIWFRQGLFYGGAEVGLTTYHPSRYLDMQQFIWWGSAAPGMLVPHFITAVPFYFILSLLENLLSPVSLQAIVYFWLLFLTGFGMYLFVISVIGQEKNKYAVIAGLFYLLNSYTMVEVWHRFLYTGIFLAAFLPFLVLLWTKWIKQGNIYFLALFLLTNLTGSYMFGSLTSGVTLWITLSMITYLGVFFPWLGKKEFLKITYRFLIGLFFWILTNLWWIIPTLSISTTFLPEQHTSEDNINTLINISKQTILPYTLQLVNPYYLFDTSELGKVYKNIFFLILPWIATLVVFAGLFVSLKKKSFSIFAIAYMLAVFLSKGAASPFGHAYIWGFINIYVLGAFRNPFEKIGILLPFFESILFVIGLEFLLISGRKKIGFGNAIVIIFCILISICIYAWPMFTGKVMSKPNEPLLVEIPNSYKQADEWLNLQNLQGNILHLPFNGDVVTYTWEHGYHGVGINEILFTSNPSIARPVGVKSVDNTLMQFTYLFNNPLTNNSDVLKTLNDFNVRFVVLHKDVKWDDVSTYGKDIRLNNPFEMESTLNSFDFFEKGVNFGDLVIYRLKNDKYLPKIVFSDNVDVVYPGESEIMQIQKLVKGNQMITHINNLNSYELQNIIEFLVFPDKILYNWEPSKNDLENILNSPITNLNPSIFHRWLERIGENYHNGGILLSEKLASKILIATDDLMNLYQSPNNIQSDAIGKSLDQYVDLIDNIFANQFIGSSLQVQYKSEIVKIFRTHLYLLRKLHENLKAEDQLKARKIYDKLNNYLVNNYILPANFFDENNVRQSFQRRVHHFDVPVKSSYELLMDGVGSLSQYPEALLKLDLQFDGKEFMMEDYSYLTKLSEDILLLGNVDLNEGPHEISYSVIESSNIAPNLASNFSNLITLGNINLIDQQIIKLNADSKGGALVGSVLSGITGGESYEIIFDGLMENTGLFYIDVLEDTESINSLEKVAGYFTDCNRSSCYTLRAASQQAGWQNYSLITKPLNLATRQSLLRIVLPPNLLTNVLSTMQIKNLKVNRIMDNNLILRKKLMEDLTASKSAALIEMREINPVRYDGRIKIDKPTFMFFKETFNPGWKLELIKDNTVYKIDKQYLGNLYNNVFYIDKIGEYDFRLEFEPQKIVNKGLLLTMFGWIGLFIVLIWYQRKKYE